MSLRHEFNRLGHLFNDGVEKAEKQATHMAKKGSKRATKLSRQVRKQVDTRAENVLSMEESLVRHVRENPALYVMGAALLIGVLIARLVLEARQAPRAPLL